MSHFYNKLIATNAPILYNQKIFYNINTAYNRLVSECVNVCLSLSTSSYEKV